MLLFLFFLLDLLLCLLLLFLLAFLQHLAVRSTFGVDEIRGVAERVGEIFVRLDKFLELRTAEDNGLC